jgi:hypothetical protein
VDFATARRAIIRRPIALAVLNSDNLIDIAFSTENQSLMKLMGYPEHSSDGRLSASIGRLSGLRDGEAPNTLFVWLLRDANVGLRPFPNNLSQLMESLFFCYVCRRVAMPTTDVRISTMIEQPTYSGLLIVQGCVGKRSSTLIILPVDNITILERDTHALRVTLACSEHKSWQVTLPVTSSDRRENHHAYHQRRQRSDNIQSKHAQ